MSEIPEDIKALAEEIKDAMYERLVRWEGAADTMTGLVADIEAAIFNERNRSTQAEREWWKPAVTYFERYCRDEADDSEDNA